MATRNEECRFALAPEMGYCEAPAVADEGDILCVDGPRDVVRLQRQIAHSHVNLVKLAQWRWPVLYHVRDRVNGYAEVECHIRRHYYASNKTKAGYTSRTRPPMDKSNEIQFERNPGVTPEWKEKACIAAGS